MCARGAGDAGWGPGGAASRTADAAVLRTQADGPLVPQPPSAGRRLGSLIPPGARASPLRAGLRDPGGTALGGRTARLAQQGLMAKSSARCCLLPGRLGPRGLHPAPRAPQPWPKAAAMRPIIKDGARIGQGTQTQPHPGTPAP